jgi:putative peptidoglycan lipid II flippase
MTPSDKETSAAEGVVRSAGIVSAAVMMSRLTGLAREIIMARLFGASQIYDAFRLGFLLPNLTRDLFAEGALSSAFVPTFTEALATKGKAEAARLFRLAATTVIFAVGALCVLGVIFAPLLVNLFAPGFRQVPGKFDLAVHLTRIQFPFLLVVALAALVMGVLNANNQFGVPAMASTFFNIGSIVFGLVLGFLIGPWLGISQIDGMAWGVVLGGALQLVWQLPSLYRSGFPYRPAFDSSDPGLRRIVRLMAPAIIGNAAVQINIMINTNFASFVEDPLRGPNGPVSWLGWAFRFMQLPLGLFGVAIGNATLPAVSRSLASGNHEEFRRTLSRSLGTVFLLTIPSSIGLVVLGRQIVGAIYQGGKFDAYDTEQTALALSCYAVGLAGYSGIKILNPAFYALNDARTPMVISLLSIAVNFTAATATLRYTDLGHAGLALATSVVTLFSFASLFWILRNKIGGVHGRELVSSTARIAVAAVGMGVVVSASTMAIERWLGLGRVGNLTALAVGIPGGLFCYYMVCRWLSVPELELAKKAVTGPLRRLGPIRRATLP